MGEKLKHRRVGQKLYPGLKLSCKTSELFRAQERTAEPESSGMPGAEMPPLRTHTAKIASYTPDLPH